MSFHLADLISTYAILRGKVTVTDEPGCDTPSHGRIYFQDKHGFTGPSAIPWP